MMTFLIIVAWLLCSAFNVYALRVTFERLPVTLSDVVFSTVFAPVVFFLSLFLLGDKIVIIERRKK